MKYEVRCTTEDDGFSVETVRTEQKIAEDDVQLLKAVAGKACWIVEV